MIAEILSYLLAAWKTAVDYLMVSVHAEISPDWRFILNIFLIAAFILGSAFLTATIAESRRHKIKFHFLLGLLIPYIYPLILALRLKTAQEAIEAEEEIDPLSGLASAMSERLKDIQQAQQSERDKRIKRIKPEKQEDEVTETEQTEQIGQVEQTEVENPAEEVVEEKSAFSQRYFQEAAVDNSGTKAGPFKLVMMNGSKFKVCQIKNIQADMASFEVEVNGKLKNIRIKYDNILSFAKI